MKKRRDPDETYQMKGDGSLRALNDAAEVFEPNQQTETAIIENDFANIGRNAVARKPEQCTHNRQTIRIKAGELHETVTAAEDVLLTADVPIYVRGQTLVRPVMETTAASDGRVTKSVALNEVHPIWLRDQLSANANWERFDKRSDKWVACNPLGELADTLVKRAGSWRFNSVSGVISAPTLRPDGSILSKPGYDRQTGLILLDSVRLPASMPKQPSRDDALAALDLLDELLSGFPFVDDAAASVGLSTIVTPIVRGCMTTSPMHVITAPTAGSGKSYLCDLAAAPVLGDACPVMSAQCNTEEMEKRIGAKLMSGHPIVCLDNINGDLGGDFLCQIIDRPIVEPRILGSSRTIRIPNQHVVFVTGNNVRLKGDLTRRAITGTLDAKMEKPSERDFPFRPFDRVLKDRGKYVGAALTIVQAFFVAGKPSVEMTPFASFEGWSNSVRAALIWLGRADPVTTAEAARKNDPEHQALEAFLTAMETEVGTSKAHAMTAAEIIAKGDAKRFEMDDYGNPRPTNELECPQLKLALTLIPTRQLSSASLGKWLARVHGRPVGGVAMQTLNVRGGTAWYADKV